MKELEGSQSYVYSIMDKLGPVRDAMAQKDDHKHCARLARKLSAFPEMSSLQLQSHHLFPEEAEMIQGGDACVNNISLFMLQSRELPRKLEQQSWRQRDGKGHAQGHLLFL